MKAETRHLLHQRQRGRRWSRTSPANGASTAVILLPDEFLARNVARQTAIGIIAWKGRCEVHERFDAADIAELRAAWPDAEILAHPECPTEVLEAADFAGSTAAMSDYVARRKPRRVVLITECSMADNVACDAPETEFVRPCNLCPHMKRISLENIHQRCSSRNATR